MRIDGHQHFWKYDPEKYSWITNEMSGIRKDFSPEDLWSELEKNNFDGSIAVQADQSEKETVKLLEYANSYEYIKGVVGWVDLSSEEVGDRLELFSRDPYFKGVRHTDWDEKGEFLLSPAFQNGISALEQYKLTFDILVFEYQLQSAIELVQKFPNQLFVLDHLGKPQISAGVSDVWAKNISTLGKHENVFCKISGLVTETIDFRWKQEEFFPFLDVVVNAFGVDRLIFGSDWPVCLAAATYEETVGIAESYFSNFSKEEKEKIFGKNAQRFYNLKG